MKKNSKARKGSVKKAESQESIDLIKKTKKPLKNDEDEPEPKTKSNKFFIWLIINCNKIKVGQLVVAIATVLGIGVAIKELFFANPTTNPCLVIQVLPKDAFCADSLSHNKDSLIVSSYNINPASYSLDTSLIVNVGEVDAKHKGQTFHLKLKNNCPCELTRNKLKFTGDTIFVNVIRKKGSITIQINDYNKNHSLDSLILKYKIDGEDVRMAKIIDNAKVTFEKVPLRAEIQVSTTLKNCSFSSHETILNKRHQVEEIKLESLNPAKFTISSNCGNNDRNNQKLSNIVRELQEDSVVYNNAVYNIKFTYNEPIPCGGSSIYYRADADSLKVELNGNVVKTGILIPEIKQSWNYDKNTAKNSRKKSVNDIIKNLSFDNTREIKAIIIELVNQR